MPRYAMPEVNTTQPLLDLFRNANTITGDLFGVGLLLTLFAIMFLSLRRFGHQGTLAATFVTTIIAYFLRTMGLISVTVGLWFFVAMVAITIFVFFRGE